MLKSIDWAKENVTLLMTSGVMHLPTSCKTIKDLSPNYVTVNQQWGADLYSIDDEAGYLRIRTYMTGFKRAWGELEDWGNSRYTRGVTGRLSDYKAALAQDPDGHFICPTGRNTLWHHARKDPGIIWVDCSMCEIRIYNTGKVAVVYTAEFPDGSQLQYMSNENLSMPWAIDCNGHPMINHTLQAYTEIAGATYGAKIVTDAEAEAAAVRLTYKEVGNLLHVLPNTAQDLRTRNVKYGNAYTVFRMAGETIDAVKQFLRCDDAENTERKKAWTKKTGSITSPAYIYELFMWLATPQHKKDAVKTKETMAEQYVTATPELQERWNNNTDRNILYWDRTPTAIIAIRFLGNYRQHRGLFAFDLKRKVRFYGDYCETTGWTFPVPSAKALTDTFESAEHVVLLNGLTPKQLFAGTNAGWLMDNAKDIQIPDPFFDYHTGGNQKLINLVNVMTSTRNSHWAMTALATSGQPLFEQLLKSGLSKLYSAALAATSTGSLDELFMKPECDSYRWNHSAWTFNAKGKNLPAMLGVPMSMIREAEALTAYQLRPTYYNSGSRSYEFCTPKIRPLLQAMPTLAAADAATRQFWLKASTTYTYYGNHIVSIAQRVSDQLPDATPARLAQLAQKYGTELMYLPDYNKARSMLQDLQRQNPGLPGLFNNRLYPAMPNKAIRFIHYIPGVMDKGEYAWLPPQLMTVDRFLKKQSSLYPDAEITPVYNDLGNELLGVRIVMSPGNNLRYLHDDANYWVNFYGQIDKGAAFCEAVRRMDGIAWKDAKLGLEIRAPQTVEELNQEGSVLAHSVASFADAIISGSTNVMFIRRLDMPEIPYYTVEIRPNGAIRQVHCYLNGGTSKEEQQKAYELSGLDCYATPKEILRFLVNWGRAFPQNVDLCTLKKEYESYLA